jgi:DNA-binding MarR family transcriptional regulator
MNRSATPPLLVSDAVIALLRTMAAQSSLIEKTTGLTHSQASLLPCLLSGGRLSASDLAHRASLSLPALTSALDVLEKRRLVRRIRNGGDRRRVWVELTSEGGALIKATIRRKHAQHLRVNSLFRPREAARLARDIVLIAKAIGAREEWLGLRCPFCHTARGGTS